MLKSSNEASLSGWGTISLFTTNHCYIVRMVQTLTYGCLIFEFAQFSTILELQERMGQGRKSNPYFSTISLRNGFSVPLRLAQRTLHHLWNRSKHQSFQFSLYKARFLHVHAEEKYLQYDKQLVAVDVHDGTTPTTFPTPASDFILVDHGREVNVWERGYQTSSHRRITLHNMMLLSRSHIHSPNEIYDQSAELLRLWSSRMRKDQRLLSMAPTQGVSN